ncbi:MAG: efflux RND transporter periplasmic adaptor subunit [Amaricoccus sp.]
MARGGLTALAAAMLAVLAAPVLAQPAPPAVSVAAAEMTEVRQSAGFTGRVTAEQKVDIRARVSGFIQEIPFKEGSRVDEGALLYRIQDDEYRASVAEIEGSIQAAEAQRELAALERDRKATLVAKKAVAQNELDVATAQLAQAEGEVARLKATLERAELQLSYTTITAPFAGIAGLSSVHVGALVGPESAPLTTLTRLDPIYVTFPVATALVLDYQAQQKAGQASKQAVVHLTLPNGQPYPLAGDIDYVSADVAQGTDTIMLRAVFDNPDGTLRDGALVKVQLEAKEADKALTVPLQAVQRDQQGAFVLVVGPDSKVEVRRVQVGATTLGRIAITDGLTEGENVIVDGINKVRPGIVVNAAVLTDG